MMMAARSSGSKSASSRARASGSAIFFEIGVGQPEFFAVALGFDEADFGGEAVESIAQGRAEACVLTEIEHRRLLISPQ